MLRFSDARCTAAYSLLSEPGTMVFEMSSSLTVAKGDDRVLCACGKRLAVLTKKVAL